MSPSQIELAGERMVMEEHADGSATFTFDDKGTGRTCSGCTLCCKLLPVVALQKAANVRCQHSKAGKGCTIYQDRPNACRLWSCRWLSDRDTAGMKRPDRVHYVIDVETDYITITYVDTGPIKVSVYQVWVDPAFPDAHRDPALRAWMLRMAEERRMATIVRYSSSRAFVVFPPPIAADGQWHEESGQVRNRTALDLQVQMLAEQAAKGSK